MPRFLRRCCPPGFTLVEMLVSLVILAILILVLSGLISGLRIAVASTTTQIGEFQEARDAFETMTRRIGQATLNSYDDINPTLTSSTNGYSRASELRFRVGNAQTLISASNTLATTNIYPTIAIFFHAPLGYTNNPANAGLMNLLNTCGYYLEWASDGLANGAAAGLNIQPQFLARAAHPIAPRYRMRLMELLEPSENISIYNYTSGPAASGTGTQSWYYHGLDWFTNPITQTQAAPPIHSIADNIVFLAFLPMVAPQNAQEPLGGNPDGTSTDIVGNSSNNSAQPPYNYDSSVSSGLNPDSLNRLPPIVWVMMIAVDEKTFSRYESGRTNPSADPSTDLGISPASNGGTFLTNASYTYRMGSASQTGDVPSVITALTTHHINYRIYTAAVPLTAH